MHSLTSIMSRNIDNTFKLKTVVLDCMLIDESHISQHTADPMRRWLGRTLALVSN